MSCRDRGNYYAPMYTCDGCGKRRASMSTAGPRGWTQRRVKVIGGRRREKNYCTDPKCKSLASTFGTATPEPEPHEH